MTMRALVLRVQRGRLLVLDLEICQQVVVITPNAQRFCRGNIIRIWYNGVMTNSIPPQISAWNIVRLPWWNSCCSC